MSITGDNQNVNINGNLVIPSSSNKIRTPLIEFFDNTTLNTANGIWSSNVSGGLLYNGNATANYFMGNASTLTSLTGATPGTYGSGTSVPTITVDSTGRISSISSTNVNSVSTGSTGQVAFYTSSNVLGGSVGLGYQANTQALTVGGSLTVGGDLFITGNTYAGNNAVFNDTIIEIGNSYPNNTTLGLLMQRPAGNVMIGYLTSEGGGAYANTLTLGYTFSSAAGAILTPDLANALPVHVLGSLTADNGLYGNLLGSNIVTAATLYGTLAGANAVSASTISGANLYGNVAGSNTISGSNISSTLGFYGSLVGSNTVSGSSISGANLYGNVAGSNTVSGSNIWATLGFYGQIDGSNTINASTISATTIYGTVAGSNTVTASTLYGSLAGSNTVSGSNISATLGFYGSIVGSNTVNASTISALTLYGTVAGANTVTASTLYGSLAGANTVSASTLITTSNVGIGSNSTANTLTVGSNLFVTDTGSNVLVVVGNVSATNFSGNGASLMSLTGASAATYGNATHVSQIIVDATGRITGISNVAISLTGTSNLAQVVNNGNVTSNTVQFTNLATSLVASGNVVANNFILNNSTIQLGLEAGYISQGTGSVAIGALAGKSNQGASSIAIGIGAGQSGQGAQAIALDTSNLNTSQAPNSVLLNASNISINPGAAGFYVAPLRYLGTGTSNVASYNHSTAEVTDSGAIVVSGSNVLVTGTSNLVGNTVASNISVFSISFGGTSNGYVRSVSLQDVTDISNVTTSYITVGSLSVTARNPVFLTTVTALGTWTGTPTPALNGSSLASFSATIGANITNFTPTGGLVNGSYTIYAVSSGSYTIAASVAGSVSNLASTLSLTTGNRVLITITYDGTVYYVNYVKYS